MKTLETTPADAAHRSARSPAKTVAFSIGEKSQIQALQRAQPILPMDFGPLDNLSAHRAPPVQRWLLRHPRVHFFRATPFFCSTSARPYFDSFLEPAFSRSRAPASRTFML